MKHKTAGREGAFSLTKTDDSIEERGPGSQGGRGRVHLVVGPVGAGKSTFARRLARARAAIYLALDEWMAVLFRPDRPEGDIASWYAERAARCVEQIWRVARGMLDGGTDAVLEIGLLSRDERESFYRRVEAAGLGCTIYVLQADRDVRRERVVKRNRERGATFSMVVPPAIFELASDLWEEPTDSECAGRDVRWLWTDDGFEFL